RLARLRPRDVPRPHRAVRRSRPGARDREQGVRLDPRRSPRRRGRGCPGHPRGEPGGAGFRGAAPARIRQGGFPPRESGFAGTAGGAMTLEIEKQTVKAEDLTKDYRFGWHDELKAAFKSERGLSEQGVRQISEMKGEPEWMLK